MSRVVYQVDIDRVVVSGARAGRAGVAELRELVASRIARELAAAPLPDGRTMRVGVRVTASPLIGAGPVADAVASAVARAVGGRS